MQFDAFVRLWVDVFGNERFKLNPPTKMKMSNTSKEFRSPQDNRYVALNFTDAGDFSVVHGAHQRSLDNM